MSKQSFTDPTHSSADHAADRNPTHLNRRHLLQSAAAGALVSSTGLAWPEAAKAQSGHINLLNVMMANVDSQDYQLRTYNGKSPGPTLRVDPGQDLDVRVVNSLQAESAEAFCPENHNSFHGANTTNFHTHGLHVSPGKSSNGQFDADNIFLNIVPHNQPVPAMCNNQNLRRVVSQFKFELPNSHPSGTFWYHAHKHGSTSRQVANGLAGPLIVDDRPGTMPSYIANAREDIFMIQLRDLTPGGAVSANPRASNGDGTLTMVRTFPGGGGEKNPTIFLRPGSVRRWRFINAATSADAFVYFTLPGIEVYQIAYDGLTLNRRELVDLEDDGDPWDNHAAMAPGNRTDFMIHVPKDAPQGEVLLTAVQSRTDILHEVDDQSPAAKAASNQVEIKVIVAGSPIDDEWSEDDWLPGSGHAPISPAGAIERKVEFGYVDGDSTKGFAIDREKFTGITKEPKMRLNTVGAWTVTNATPFTHPFHIHVNPFFITHINGKELARNDPRRRWQDTIALPPQVDGVDGEIRFLTRYETFTGEFVIHCHILGHEDTGMMQKVAVTA